MTSTGFTVGLEGSTRNSSKVLKPPGGGSSDIFGRGSPLIASNGTRNDNAKNQETSTNTQNRLFGISSESTATPIRSQVKSNIFENTQHIQAPKTTGKRYAPQPARRNPITGEEVDYFPDNHQKAENNGTKETDDCNGQTVSEQNCEKVEEKTDIPRKPVQTSIRVRNPPGGKSSGIF